MRLPVVGGGGGGGWVATNFSVSSRQGFKLWSLSPWGPSLADPCLTLAWASQKALVHFPILCLYQGIPCVSSLGLIRRHCLQLKCMVPQKTSHIMLTLSWGGQHKKNNRQEAHTQLHCVSHNQCPLPVLNSAAGLSVEINHHLIYTRWVLLKMISV